MTRGRPRGFAVDDAAAGAMRLFWRRGYRSTTTRDVEGALGIAPSSLYRAFGSKEGLLDAALARYLAEIRAALITPLATSGDGLDALDRFLAGLGDWLTADGGRGCMVSRLMAEGPRPSRAVDDRLTAHRAELRAAVTGALERAARAGEIPEGTVGSRTSLVVAAVLGMNLAAQSGWDPEAHRALTRDVREEVLRWRAAPGPGLRPAPPG